ncbi:unnamed protein product [Amoebophrya sp. A120]|nr:unnamed protein product [Amoebophrya sp. A120]|eukprot:GSA120T00008389001.1
MKDFAELFQHGRSYNYNLASGSSGGGPLQQQQPLAIDLKVVDTRSASSRSSSTSCYNNQTYHGTSLQPQHAAHGGSVSSGSGVVQPTSPNRPSSASPRVGKQQQQQNQNYTAGPQTAQNDNPNKINPPAAQNRILQCLKLYGFEKPTKLQAHTIPAVFNVVSTGSGLTAATTASHSSSSSNREQGKSCVVIQGPPKSGKTSALALAVAAGVNPLIKHCQALVLCMSERRDFEKFFNVFTMLHPVKLCSLYDDKNSSSGTGTAAGIGVVGGVGAGTTTTGGHLGVIGAQHPMEAWSGLGVGNQGPGGPMDIDETGSVASGPHRPNFNRTHLPENHHPATFSPSSDHIGAQVIAGRPGDVLKFLNTQDVCLDYISVLILDDAQDLCTSTIGGNAGGGTSVLDRAASASSDQTPIPVVAAAHLQKTTTQMDEVIQVSHLVECRILAQKLKYVLSSQMINAGGAAVNGPPGTSSSSSTTTTQQSAAMQQALQQQQRKVLRMLKSSVMKKKNLFSVMPDLPTKLRSNVKHYVVEAKSDSWCKILKGLVNALLFPKAVVFCDDKKKLDLFPAKMKELGLQTSVNLSYQSMNNLLHHQPGGAAAAMGGNHVVHQGGPLYQQNLNYGQVSMENKRLEAVTDFHQGKTKFLFTVSEPSLCKSTQLTTSCVFHLDLPQEMLSVYAVRLLALDANPNREVVSVLFVEKAAKLVPELGKLFNVQFLDMPVEFIPM